MGLLNTFFVGTDIDAMEYAHHHHDMLADVWQSKGITELHLAELWATLLQGKDTMSISGVLDLEDQFKSMRREDEEWICRFPADFTTRLAALTDSDLETASEEWVKFEEMNMCTPSDAAFIITRLRRLAKLAHEEGANIYLWICL